MNELSKYVDGLVKGSLERFHEVLTHYEVHEPLDIFDPNCDGCQFAERLKRDKDRTQSS